MRFYDLFGAMAKEHRLMRGLSQEQLADLVGVSRATIVNIETGKFAVQLLIAMDVLRVLKIPFEAVQALHSTYQVEHDLGALRDDIRDVVESNIEKSNEASS